VSQEVPQQIEEEKKDEHELEHAESLDAAA